MKTTKNLIIPISAILLVMSSLALVSADPNDYGCMGGLITGGYGSGFAILSWITYILFIVLIIAAIYWLIKNASNKDKK